MIENTSSNETLYAAILASGPQGVERRDLAPAGGPGESIIALLVREGRVLAVGDRLVAAVCGDPVEAAMGAIVARAPSPGHLALRAELFKGLAGPLRAAAPQALDRLTREGRLTAWRRGRTVYYSAGEAAAGPPEVLDLERAREAYRNVRAREGFVNVEISALQQELGVDGAVLHRFLLDACGRGLAALSRGDWSLASEQARGAAITVDDLPYLYVRLAEDAHDEPV